MATSRIIENPDQRSLTTLRGGRAVQPGMDRRARISLRAIFRSTRRPEEGS
jgi:hypothetical protein